MGERNDQLASLDKGKKLPKSKNVLKGEDEGVALSGRRLSGKNPAEVKSRADDNKQADQILEEMPIDVSEVTIVDPLKGIKDRRIVKLPDGTLAIHHFTTNTIYIEKGRKMSGVLAVYNFDTGAKIETVFGSGFDEKSALAYVRLKEMNDKLHLAAPDSIDVRAVETVGAVGSERSIVKFSDGTLAVKHLGRKSYLAEYRGVVFEYSAKTGERDEKTTEISQVGGETRRAFGVIAKMRAAKDSI